MQKKKTKSKQKSFLFQSSWSKRVKLLSFANSRVCSKTMKEPACFLSVERICGDVEQLSLPTGTTNKHTMGLWVPDKVNASTAKHTRWTVREHKHFMTSTFKEHILYGFWRVLFADKNFKESKLGFNSLVFLIFLKHRDAILLLGIPSILLIERLFKLP